jgi:hypothetical protein
VPAIRLPSIRLPQIGAPGFPDGKIFAGRDEVGGWHCKIKLFAAQSRRVFLQPAGAGKLPFKNLKRLSVYEPFAPFCGQ